MRSNQNRQDVRQAPPEPRLAPNGWWFDGVMLLLLAGITAGVAVPSPLTALDVTVRNFVDSHRPPAAENLAQALNYLGQELPLALVCVSVALALVWRQRTWEPVLPVLSAFVLSYASLGALKLLTDRSAPHHGSVLLFSEPSAMSYPSGHAANAMIWYGVLAMFLIPLPAVLRGAWPRRLIWWAPVLVVGLASTYLGYHWVTDVIAGLVLGLIVVRLVRRQLWRRLRLPPGWSRRIYGFADRP